MSDVSSLKWFKSIIGKYFDVDHSDKI